MLKYFCTIRKIIVENIILKLMIFAFHAIEKRMEKKIPANFADCHYIG
jgi:hypothetical protein